MRRASVLVAVTAVSLVIVSACTSFPDLTVDEGLTGSDGAPAGGNDGAVASEQDGGAGTGAEAGTDGSSSTGSDASTGPKDAAADTGSTGPKDSSTTPDTGPPDTGPDVCAAAKLDCTADATKNCSMCLKECPTNTCTGVTSSCCAIEMGMSGMYTPCCYAPTVIGASCTNFCFANH